MNSSSGASTLGPLDLIYHGADEIFRGAEGLLGSGRAYDFIQSVRWREPFILLLILSQMFLFLLTYATRKREILQFGILLSLTVITLAAERLNNYGRRHWQTFASQNYFDRQGLFMMIFVSGPMVVLANFIVIGMGQRLVHLYARRMRKQNQERQVRDEGASGTTGEKKNI